MARYGSQYWETRVDNDPDMWASIRAAAEALLAGDVDHANVLLEASNITTPSASLGTCFDARGAEYRVPRRCGSCVFGATDDGPGKACGKYAFVRD